MNCAVLLITMNYLRKIEENDYFLPLLDNRMTEHERYITIGTSGSFQLIYGFAKPCLIHTKFADYMVLIMIIVFFITQEKNLLIK